MRNATPAPATAGMVSAKLTVRKKAMEISRPGGSGRPADQTFRDCRGAFKAAAGAERGDRRPAAHGERAPGGARAGDRDGVDLGDDLLERNRPAVGQHLARELADACLR